jgi:hypothetical protein
MDNCSRCPMLVTCLAREMTVVQTRCSICRSLMGIPVDESWEPILGYNGKFPIGYSRMKPCKRHAPLRKGKRMTRGCCTKCLSDIKRTRDVKRNSC